jgi:hypothetical protein
MKITYLKPQIRIISLEQDEAVLNTGSIYTKDGKPSGTQGSGVTPVGDGGGTIWGDSKGTDFNEDDD